MPKKMEKTIVEHYKEILNSTAGEVHKKGVFNLLAKELDAKELAKVAVEQFTATKNQFYPDKVTEIIEGALKESVYDAEEGAKHAELCECIQEICETSDDYEELIEWIEQLSTVVLKYAPVCNCNEFIVTILGSAAKYKVPVVSWQQALMQVYKSNNKTALFVESMAHYKMAMKSRCVCNYIDSYWDEEDEEWVIESGYDPEYCDSAKCNVTSCIMAFTTAICRHKSWIDSVGWKAIDNYKAMCEEYEKYIAEVEEAYQVLVDLKCRLLDMELFTSQWELFSSKYVHRKQLRNFDYGLETRAVPVIAAETEI